MQNINEIKKGFLPTFPKLNQKSSSSVRLRHNFAKYEDHQFKMKTPESIQKTLSRLLTPQRKIIRTFTMKSKLKSIPKYYPNPFKSPA
jgi:hypothetical protein